MGGTVTVDTAFVKRMGGEMPDGVEGWVNTAYTAVTGMCLQSLGSK